MNRDLVTLGVVAVIVWWLLQRPPSGPAPAIDLPPLPDPPKAPPRARAAIAPGAVFRDEDTFVGGGGESGGGGAERD